MVYTPSSSQFFEAIAYYFGEKPTPPSGLTPAQAASEVGTWGSHGSPSPTRGLIGTWDVSNVNDMTAAFSANANGASPNRGLFNEDIGGWDTSNVTNMGGMFDGCFTFNQDISSWDTSKVTNMNGMFSMAVRPVGATPAFDQDIRGWVVGATTDLGSMFRDLNIFLSTYQVLGTPTSTFFNQGRFTPPNNTVFQDGLAYYFGEGPLPSGWTADQIGTATGIPQTIATWDTSQVTSMADAFNASTLGQSARATFNTSINNWNVSNVISMRSMFTEAKDFNQNIVRWNVSNVVDMSYMFACSASAPGAFNADIVSWDVSSVTNMEAMFQNQKDFDAFLITWQVRSNTNLFGMFQGATTFIEDYRHLPYFGITPDWHFFGYARRPTLASMAPKNTYGTNASYATTRAIATRAVPPPYFPFPGAFPGILPIPHKTQNRDGAGGRLRRIKAKAVVGDGYRNRVVPNSGGADPNTVSFALALTRNQGSVAPPKAGANNVS